MWPVARLDLAGARRAPDDDVIAALVQVKGIGRWTAEMFLIFALGRLDVLPVDDLGFRRAVRARLRPARPARCRPPRSRAGRALAPLPLDRHLVSLAQPQQHARAIDAYLPHNPHLLAGIHARTTIAHREDAKDGKKKKLILRVSRASFLRGEFMYRCDARCLLTEQRRAIYNGSVINQSID